LISRIFVQRKKEDESPRFENYENGTQSDLGLKFKVNQVKNKFNTVKHTIKMLGVT